MPELPELEILKDSLKKNIKGRTISSFQVLKPYVVKNYFTGNLHSENVEDITRRGKFLLIFLTRYKIIIHLMLHGIIRFIESGTKVKKSTGAIINFQDGSILEMSETGSKKRMSINVIPKDEPLEKIEHIGIEPLGKDFTVEKFENLLKSDSRQLKHFLCDQHKIAGIGNAYADEILWHARLSPFRLTTNLDDSKTRRLHTAVITVLNWAISKIREKGITEKRDFLNVHGKKGKKCPACGAAIQFVSFSDTDTFYCPQCQTEGKILKDRRMSKFYR